MTGQRYIDEVLLLHVRLFRGAVGDKFVFMDDNATCHRTLAVQDCLDSEGIQRLVWPARSPDLNSIENVWDALRRQVARRNYPPTKKNTLIRALTEEWDNLPQQLLDNVVQSMVNSVPIHTRAPLNIAGSSICHRPQTNGVHPNCWIRQLQARNPEWNSRCQKETVPIPRPWRGKEHLLENTEENDRVASLINSIFLILMKCSML
ncbi:transposable element Tcb1 transposase [Trichonephila clavipes]|nr:transposable element Tcb1 transposase [Trichonephila clavipes]